MLTAAEHVDVVEMLRARLRDAKRIAATHKMYHIRHQARGRIIAYETSINAIERAYRRKNDGMESK